MPKYMKKKFKFHMARYQNWKKVAMWRHRDYVIKVIYILNIEII